MKNKLLEFKIDGGGMRHFEIHGDTKETILDFSDNPYLDFSDIEMYEIKEGTQTPYEPVATAWATGRKLTVYDATDDVINRMVRNQTEDFEVLYVREDIKEFVDNYRKNKALVFAEREIPYRIINNKYISAYELHLATDSFLYYMNCDEMIMLRTASGELVSDNYFAEVGYYESLEAIEKGEEKKLEFQTYEQDK